MDYVVVNGKELKYGADHLKKMSIKTFCNRLKARIDKKCSIDELCDFIDDEFIYGAWAEFQFPDVFLKNIRGIFIEMYKSNYRELVYKDFEVQ